MPAQYPHQCEIVFAPFTALEVINETPQASVQVIEVRASEHMKIATVEHAVAKRQNSLLAQIDTNLEKFRAIRMPERVLTQLMSVRSVTGKRPPNWFIDPVNFKAALINAIEANQACFQQLANKDIWGLPWQRLGTRGTIADV